MRILHLISSSGLYGAENVILTLCRSLRQKDHYGSIGVFHNLHSPNLQLMERAAQSGVEARLITCKDKIDFKVPRAIRELVSSERSDIIHCHGYKPDIYSFFALNNSEVPLVATCHTWYDNDPFVYLYGAIDRYVLRSFNAVIAVSESVAGRLAKAGVKKQQVRIINNGIDVSKFAAVSPGLREELGFGDKIVIGLVGRLAPEKGVDLFLHAAAALRRAHNQLVFVVAGQGPMEVELRELANRLGLSGGLIFLGQRQDIASVYASLDVLVSASLDEGLPLTLLEALAASRPVVATRVGAVPRFIIHEQTGLLVEPGNACELADAVDRLLRDPELRAKLGEEGKQLVSKQFSADVMSASYLQLYEAVLKTKRRTSID